VIDEETKSMKANIENALLRQTSTWTLMCLIIAVSVFFSTPDSMAEKGEVVHDAEYYILETQNREKWR